MSFRVLRTGVGLASATAGTFGVLGLLLVMNGMDRSPPEPPAKKAIAMDVAPQPKPQRKPRPKPRPRPQPSQSRPAPIPTLAAGVGGLDLGLFGAGGLDLGGAAESLLGDGDLTTMTADSVDTLPTPTRQAPASYPPRARNQGITGHVVLALDIDASGRLTDARVDSAVPPGVFDEAALQTVRRWQFAPATYQGAPVAVSGVELRIDFDLEQR